MENYKETLRIANTKLATDPLVRFIGYGLRTGGALGSLADVSKEKIIETPVAENLMVGMAIGLSLTGLHPVVYIERMDFMMNAMDVIVNHLDKIKEKSSSEFSPGVIIRATVGNKNKPLYTGITHTQDFSVALRLMVRIPVLQLCEPSSILDAYQTAHENIRRGESTILVEYKDFV